MARLVRVVLAALAAIGAVAARPAPGSHGAVVIWHGLGDSFDAEGMTQLAETIQERYPGTFVHVIRQGEDGAADRKASFFGNAAAQVDTAYSQLLALLELRNGFDAVGFSQGGVLLRALVQEHAHELPPIRKLITLGSPHLGVARLPPCGSGDLLCRATEWALRAGVWTTYAQSKVIPAQYFRNQEDIARYLVSSGWLRRVNNERWGDKQVGGSENYLEEHPELGDEADQSPRNSTYAKNLASLSKLVAIRFSEDKTIDPPTSAIFTLVNQTDSLPIPLDRLPLYRKDYIGLRALDKRGALDRDRVCLGEHMQIVRSGSWSMLTLQDEACWTMVLDELASSSKATDVRG